MLTLTNAVRTKNESNDRDIELIFAKDLALPLGGLASQDND